MRRLAAILALVLGLTLLAAPPVSAAVAAHAENRASGSAAGLTTLIEIEARLSEEAVRENASLGYDLASDGAVAARGTARSVGAAATQKVSRAGMSAKEAAKDVPSWVRGERPVLGEKGRDFATRVLDGKYGQGNYPKGPGSEFSKIQKWGDRAFQDPPGT